MIGERKQVTVLFADVQNSLALADSMDLERWHEILDRLFAIFSEAVHRYQGTINQYTGDGIMALFGAPVAHEQHAQGACFAALAIKRGLEPFAAALKREDDPDVPVRIGLNSGEVVVGRI